MANTVTITGRLTRDPNYTEGTEAKKSRAFFTVASDRAGEGTDFVPVTVFGKTADAASKYLSQGHQVAVTGHLASSSFERDGNTNYSLDVIGERVDFLGKPATASGPGKAMANAVSTDASTRDHDGPGF